MPKLKGQLVDPALGGIKAVIKLESIKTTGQVLKNVSTDIITDETGNYEQQVAPGKYKVTLSIKSNPDFSVGSIDINSDSPDGSLNDFLLLGNNESILTPEIVRQIQQYRDETKKAAEEAKALIGTGGDLLKKGDFGLGALNLPALTSFREYNESGFYVAYGVGAGDKATDGAPAQSANATMTVLAINHSGVCHYHVIETNNITPIHYIGTLWKDSQGWKLKWSEPVRSDFVRVTGDTATTRYTNKNEKVVDITLDTNNFFRFYIENSTRLRYDITRNIWLYESSDVQLNQKLNVAGLTTLADTTVKSLLINNKKALSENEIFVDIDGIAKSTAARVRLFNDDTVAAELSQFGFTAAGKCAVNTNAAGVEATRETLGIYHITGVKAIDITSIPTDINGNQLLFVESETAEGSITIKTYQRQFNVENGQFVAGDPIDIQDSQFIDILVQKSAERKKKRV